VARVTIIIEDDIVKGQEVVKMNIQHDPNGGTVKDKNKPCSSSAIVGMGVKRLFDTQAIHKLAINCCPDMLQANKDYEDKKPKLYMASAGDINKVERSKT
jgi:hypothetical protein